MFLGLCYTHYAAGLMELWRLWLLIKSCANVPCTCWTWPYVTPPQTGRTWICGFKINQGVPLQGIFTKLGGDTKSGMLPTMRSAWNTATMVLESHLEARLQAQISLLDSNCHYFSVQSSESHRAPHTRIA